MDSPIRKKILKDKRVKDEIQRHLWIESEKAGVDKGIEWAKLDWLEKFSKAWMDYHLPQQHHPSNKSSAQETGSRKKARSSKIRKLST